MHATKTAAEEEMVRSPGSGGHTKEKEEEEEEKEEEKEEARLRQ